MKNTFDRIASFYDGLAKAVFGDTWEDIQFAAVSEINQCERVLIAGGGSGKILERIASHVHVTYVEFSGGMLTRARKRSRICDVEFIEADFLQWNSTEGFDLIYFPFFLDSFSDKHLEYLVARSKRLLKDDGRVCVLDFKDASWLKNLLVKIMYLFFRLTANLEATMLLDFGKYFDQQGLKGKRVSQFFSNWIVLTVYCR